jgi:hypothetical protein
LKIGAIGAVEFSHRDDSIALTEEERSSKDYERVSPLSIQNCRGVIEVPLVLRMQYVQMLAE